MQTVVAECDGATLKSNPGEIGGGIAIVSSAGELLAELAPKFEGIGTNNDSEYQAVISALEFVAKEMPLVTDLHIRTDSSLVVNQVAGRWQIKDDRLRAYAQRIWDLSWSFEVLTIEWIKRELNEHADALSKTAVHGTFLPNLIQRDTLGIGTYPYIPLDRTWYVRDERNHRD